MAEDSAHIVVSRVHVVWNRHRLLCSLTLGVEGHLIHHVLLLVLCSTRYVMPRDICTLYIITQLPVPGIGAQPPWASGQPK